MLAEPTAPEPDARHDLEAAQARLDARREAQGIRGREPQRIGGDHEAHEPRSQPPQEPRSRPRPSGSRLRVIGHPDAEAEGGGDFDPLVEPGEYSLGFAAEKRITLYKRTLWAVTFRILDAREANGAEVRLFATIPISPRPRPSWKLAALWAAGTRSRPPRDLARRRPSNYLADCTFRARVRTVALDWRGEERPEALQYSVVERLIERTAGVPPCMKTSE